MKPVNKTEIEDELGFAVQYLCGMCGKKWCTEKYAELCCSDYKERHKEQIRRQYACLKACEGISTHALEYGVIPQLIEAVEAARNIIGQVTFLGKKERERELVYSRLNLVLSKVRDAERGE